MFDKNIVAAGVAEDVDFVLNCEVNKMLHSKEKSLKQVDYEVTKSFNDEISKLNDLFKEVKGLLRH